MYPGNSLIRNDEPEEGGNGWDPFADERGGRSIQFPGAPLAVRSASGSEDQCWQTSRRVLAPGSCSMLWGKAGSAASLLGYFCSTVSGLDPRSLATSLLSELLNVLSV